MNDTEVSAYREAADLLTPPQLPIVECRMCGRHLTDRISRLYQLGPECRGKLVPRPRAALVDQDPLPFDLENQQP